MQVDERLSWSATLAILVVNYGSHELVAVNLQRSIDAHFAGHVVIVDNFTTSEEQQKIQTIAASSGWECVAVDENLGFGAGMNLAAQTAIRLGASELLLLNPDAHMDAQSIQNLHARVTADPMALVAPIVVRPDGRIFSEATDLYLDRGESLARSKRALETPDDRVQPWVSGACMAIGTSLWQKVGGFDDDYFLYWEDIDLCARAQAMGASIEVEKSARAVHDPGATQRETADDRVKSPLYYYYNTRNRLLYASKHLNRSDQRKWRRKTIAASYRILLRGGRRQFVNPSKSIFPAVRGMRDGLRLLMRSSRRNGNK